MKTSRPLLALFLAGVIGVAGGCKKKEKDPAGPLGVKIGLVLPDAGDPFYKAVQAAAQEEAKDPERSFELLVQDAKGKASEQARGVEQLVQQGANVILVSPIDVQKLRPALQKANNAKVYLVMLEASAPDVDVSTTVEFNQELVGELCADYLAQRLKSGGRVGIIGSGKAPGEPQRLQAFKEYLRRKQPSIQVVDEVAADSEAGQRAAVENLLKANPNLSAVYTLTDEIAMLATGVIRARAGGGAASGAPFVVSYGGLPRAVEELQKPGSPLAMTVAALPQRLGARSARIAWRIAANKPTPSHVGLPLLPVTKDNYGTFPGWEGQVPASITIPWTSELELKEKRED
ncbi:MAG TPA: sugar ABC transporter substrate-binding protein [Armatimonadota bacterium]|nr:sugar ABC transporter substrate-binding protein [Armatimonadota bacterium]